MKKLFTFTGDCGILNAAFWLIIYFHDFAVYGGSIVVFSKMALLVGNSTTVIQILCYYVQKFNTS